MTTYDDWKTTNPADNELGPEPKATCDCCGELRVLTQAWPMGMETWACDECRGMGED